MDGGIDGWWMGVKAIEGLLTAIKNYKMQFRRRIFEKLTSCRKKIVSTENV